MFIYFTFYRGFQMGRFFQEEKGNRLCKMGQRALLPPLFSIGIGTFNHSVLAYGVSLVSKTFKLRILYSSGSILILCSKSMRRSSSLSDKLRTRLTLSSSRIPCRTGENSNALAVGDKRWERRSFGSVFRSM